MFGHDPNYCSNLEWLAGELNKVPPRTFGEWIRQVIFRKPNPDLVEAHERAKKAEMERWHEIEMRAINYAQRNSKIRKLEIKKEGNVVDFPKKT